jgi:hypothetical protein
VISSQWPPNRDGRNRGSISQTGKNRDVKGIEYAMVFGRNLVKKTFSEFIP